MSDYVLINGHYPTCAYIRSLDDLFEADPCDCQDHPEHDDLAPFDDDFEADHAG